MMNFKNIATISQKQLLAAALVLFTFCICPKALFANCEKDLEQLSTTQSAAISEDSVTANIKSLAALKLKLDLAKVDGSSSEAITAMMSNYKKKEKGLIEYFEKNQSLTRDQFLEKMRQEIARLQGKQSADQKDQNENMKKETQRKREEELFVKNNVVDGYRVILHKIAPGDFMMGEPGKEVPTRLTYMPEIMATSMTQFIYKQIAELANAKFPEKYQIKSNPSAFKSDTKPVEKVSYVDVELWTKALNDLSDIGEPLLNKLIVGHKKGMRYSGFMTEAQREYLMKKAKTEDGDSIDEMIKRNDKEKLKQYARFTIHFPQGTEPVDQAKPLFIDGKAFYGLHGNVWEWVKDFYANKLSGGIDPQGPKEPTSNNIVRGGSYFSEEISLLSSTYRNEYPPNIVQSDIGFRLVRLPQP